MDPSASSPIGTDSSAEAARSRCTTTSECLRRLIHEAREPTQQDGLERKLIAGLESGDPIEITPESWAKKRRDIVERYARKNA